MTSTGLPSAIEIVCIGVTATVTLDIWALVLQRVFGQPATNWSHVGRWVAGLPAGQARHARIADAPARAGERAIGWTTHYVVGIVYAAIYLLVLGALARSPGLVSAVAFGLVTVLAPWLILQPGLGAGLFARQTPNPNAVRIRNVAAHAVFGAGLYLGWQLLMLLR